SRCPPINQCIHRGKCSRPLPVLFGSYRMKPRDSFTGTAQLQDRIPAGERLQLGKESFPSIPARGADLPLLTPPGSVRWVVEVNGDEIPRSPPILVWLQELTAPHQVIAVAGPVVVPVSSEG